MKTIIHTQQWKDYVAHYIMEENGLGMVRVIDWGCEELEITDLYVDEKHRNRGIATQLIEEAIDLCKAAHVHGKIIIETNHNSSAWVDEWYKRLGFNFERMQAPLTVVLGEDDWSNVYGMAF